MDIGTGRFPPNRRVKRVANREPAGLMFVVPQLGQQAVEQPAWSGQLTQAGFWAGSNGWPHTAQVMTLSIPTHPDQQPLQQPTHQHGEGKNEQGHGQGHLPTPFFDDHKQAGDAGNEQGNGHD